MKKWFGGILTLVVVGILIGLVVIPAIAQGGGEAQVPTSISYQGYLEDGSGPVTQTGLQMEFALYETDSGGSSVWAEVQSVDVTDGLFSVLLGSGSPMAASDFEGERYLGISVDGDGEMTPRQKLASVAYSLVAEQANTAFSLSAPDGDPEDAVYVDNAGKVGIGTGTPTAELEIGTTIPTKVKSSKPTIVGTRATSEYADGVYVSGKYAYVADGDKGLKVIDISDPTSPTIVGTCDTYWADGVYVSGKYAYVADGDKGLKVIDISDPTSPTIVGTRDTSYAEAVYVSGKYAYVADGNAGLKVIDISDPGSPTTVGTRNTPGSAYGVYVSGKYAYVADYDKGLKVIDISNPGSPTIVGTRDTYWARGVYVSGKYAYVADDSAGLKVIDISDPGSPTTVGTCDTYWAYGVYVSGKYAYVADYTAGLKVIDISGIDTPAISAGNVETSDITINENADVGNNLYVRNGVNIGPGGLYVDAGNGITTDGEIVALGTVTAPEFAAPFYVSGSATIGNPNGSGQSTWQGTSSYANDGYLETPWVYASMFEAPGERGTGSTGIAVGAGNGYTSDDQISLIIDGNEVLRVNSNGKVGIGLTNPDSMLQVEGTAKVTQLISSGTPEGIITLHRQNNEAGGGKLLFKNLAAWYEWNIYQTDGTSSDLRIAGGSGKSNYDDLPDRLTITNGGNVGIGTTSPARKLHISNVMRLEPRASAPSSPANGDIYFGTDGYVHIYNGAWNKLDMTPD